MTAPSLDMWSAITRSGWGWGNLSSSIVQDLLLSRRSSAPAEPLALDDEATGLRDKDPSLNEPDCRLSARLRMKRKTRRAANKAPAAAHPTPTPAAAPVDIDEEALGVAVWV